MKQSRSEPKKIDAYGDVKIPIPTLDDSLLRDPGQNARAVALEKMRAYAFTPRLNPDAVRGLGSLRNTIGRKLKASESKRNWEKNQKTIYEDNSNA